MLKRKGQTPNSTERLTRGQLEAYYAAFAAIRPGFDEIRQIRRQVRRFQETPWKPRAGLSDAIAIVTVAGIDWRAQSLLLRLPKCAVFLCRHPTANEFAIIHLFPAESAYAKANGQDQVLLRNADPRQLLREYAGQAQHTLRFMASNLVAKAQRVAFEQFPKHNPGRVMRAISEHCRRMIRESVTVAESIRQTNPQGQGTRA